MTLPYNYSNNNCESYSWWAIRTTMDYDRNRRRDENVNNTGGAGSGNLTSGNYSYSTQGTSPDALSTPYDNRPTYYTLLYLIRIA